MNIMSYVLVVVVAVSISSCSSNPVRKQYDDLATGNQVGHSVGHVVKKLTKDE